MSDKASLIEAVGRLLDNGHLADAAALLRREYPFTSPTLGKLDVMVAPWLCRDVSVPFP